MKRLLFVMMLILSFSLVGFSQNSIDIKVKNTLAGIVVLSGEGGITIGQTDYNNIKLDFIGKGSVEYFLDTNSKTIFGFRIFAAEGFVSGKKSEFIPQELRTAFHLVGGGLSIMYAASDVVYPYASIGLSHMWVYPRDNNNVNFKNMFKILAFNGELGLRFMVSNNFSINIAGGAMTGFDDGNEDNIDGHTIGNHKDWVATATIGLSYYIDRVVDSDGDGVGDPMDVCPGTPMSVKVDAFGCPLDNDNDGVGDYMDKCPNTPPGVHVDANGCPLDSDNDGIADYMDICSNTPAGIKIDEYGCPFDSDNDGIADYMDKCSNTPAGVKVDVNGCPLDSDGDGIQNDKDKCPNTPKNREVDANGCTVKKEVKSEVMSGDANFEYNKAELQPYAFAKLDEIAITLKNNSDYYARILGYTDSIGSEEANLKLSLKRAQAVADYLILKGVNRNRLQIVPMGEANPVVSNITAAGRAANRRVEIKISQQ